MTTWITTDFHLGHHFAIETGWREPNFESKIVSWYSKNVKDGDTVINLGDFSFTNKETTLKLLEGLKGRAILVRGNHDSRGINWYYDCGFSFVCDNFAWHYKGKNIIFSHRPYPIELMSNYDINIHGHMHTKKEFVSDKHYLVCIEDINYHMVNLDAIIYKVCGCR